MSDRYTDQPFLRFVDAWVLKAIGHLDQPTEEYCTAMVPNLEKSFGHKGSWDAIVAKQMGFGPDLAAQIRQIWADGQARYAEANGEAANPAHFAMIFVDQNLRRS